MKTPSNIELPQDHSWTKVEVENPHEKFTLDTWENSDLIEQCQNNPGNFILLPPIYVANQELWDEQNLNENIGDIRRDLLESGIPSKSIPCMKVLKSKKLVWKVYRLSPLYSKIKEVPSVIINERLPNSLVFFTCSLILIGLGLFATIVFRHKVASRALFYFVASCLCLSAYGFLCCSGLWSSGLIIHKNAFLIVLFKVLGIHFTSLFLFEQNYLGKSLKLYSVFTLIILLVNCLLFYSEPNLFFTFYRALCFPYFLIFIVSYFGSTLSRMTRARNIQNLVVFIASSILLLAAFNDILNFFVLIKSHFLVLAAMLFVLIAHLYFFKNEVSSMIVQRDRYKRKLDEAYREKLDIISKNTVAHTIANTVQRIACDIKAPFYMIKLTFNELKAGRINLDQTFALANHAEKSVDYVDNLLIDLLTASKERSNKLEPLELAPTLQACWVQAKHLDDSTFKLETQLHHTNKLFADKLKSQRIFINLFKNAKEATGRQGGKIWVKTTDTSINDRPYTEITIGNENSSIAKQDRTIEFSPAYTLGKNRGSGLGHAICYEAVLSHGGQIRCESNQEKNIHEIIFTLPSLK
ncbi:MAG: sensor histidine kinase [Oligoflexales bacterium]|nr:sensor histidine kinase [Oligoflexales bacterium]